MEKINWSKAPEWANAVIASQDGQAFYVSQFGGISARQRVGYSQVDDNASADMITPHDWTLVETRHPAWTGEGLPPAGTVCEVKGAIGHYLEWKKVEVFAVRGRTVFFDHENGWAQTDSHEFRPIRTPEQVAEDELNQAALAMYEELESYLTLAQCHVAIKNGYRKQPTDQ